MFVTAPDVMASPLVTTWLQVLPFHAIPMLPRPVVWVTCYFSFKIIFKMFACLIEIESRQIEFTMALVSMCIFLYAKWAWGDSSNHLLLLKRMQFTYYRCYIGQHFAQLRQTMAFGADGLSFFDFIFLMFDIQRRNNYFLITFLVVI